MEPEGGAFEVGFEPKGLVEAGAAVEGVAEPNGAALVPVNPLVAGAELNCTEGFVA